MSEYLEFLKDCVKNYETEKGHKPKFLVLDRAKLEEELDSLSELHDVAK